MSTMTLTVQRLCGYNLEKVARLRERIDVPRSDDFIVQERRKDERSIVLAFRREDAIVGTIRVTPLDLHGCAELGRLALDPDARMLLVECFRACAAYMEEHHPHLHLGLAWCKPSAARLYESFGWRPGHGGVRTIGGEKFILMQGTVNDILVALQRKEGALK